jgi:putative hydrolase of the HAD superfamily
MEYGFPWQQYETPHHELFQGASWWKFMEEKLATLLRELGIPWAMADHISKDFRSEYLDIKYWHLYEDTHRVLAAAKELGYINYIISNHAPELPMIVEGLGISKLIHEIFCSALIGYDKPHHKIYQFALNRIPDDFTRIMIGDNYISDIVGARSNSIQGILVRSENTNNHDYFTTSLDGVLELVSRILCRSDAGAAKL